MGALLGPWITPHDPVAIDLSRPFAKPIWLDLVKGAGNLGKDNLYRDVFSRVIVGSRTSLIVAFSAVLIGIISGVSLGLIAGYKRGLVDDIIMRVADTQTAIPFLVLLIAVIAFLGGSLLNMILFLGLGSWVGLARLIRDEELSIRERNYVHAEEAPGEGDLRTVLSSHST